MKKSRVETDQEFERACESVLQNLSSTVGDQQDQRDEKQDQSQGTIESRGKDLAPMLAVDFGPCGELGLILRFEALFLVPPGAAAVEIISNVRGADDWHFSPLILQVGRSSIAQIFYF
jgi:hypothetical protein